MIPWDFGLINAFKKQLNYKVLPSVNEKEEPPYIVFTLDKYYQKNIFAISADFSLTIVDINEWSNNRFEIAKKINKIIQFPLSLYHKGENIGQAQVKNISLDSKQNNIILKMTAMLYLSPVSEENAKKDGEETEK